MDEKFLGTDIALFNGDFVVTSTGDIALASERDCLIQDIVSVLFSSEQISEFINDESTDINKMDLAQVIEEIIEEDPRVIPGSVKSQVEEWTKDMIRILVIFTPIDDGNPINLVIGFNLEEITVEVL